jgi:hypothetical protein
MDMVVDRSDANPELHQALGGLLRFLAIATRVSQPALRLVKCTRGTARIWLRSFCQRHNGGGLSHRSRGVFAA